MRLKLLVLAVLSLLTASILGGSVRAWDYVWGNPGPNNYSRYQIAALGNDGTTYVAGIFAGEFFGLVSPSAYQGFIQRIDSSGEVSWTRPVEGTSLQEVVVDGLGIAYLSLGNSLLSFDEQGEVIATASYGSLQYRDLQPMVDGGVSSLLYDPRYSNWTLSVNRFNSKLESVWAFDLGRFKSGMHEGDYFDDELESGGVAVAKGPDESIWAFVSNVRSLPHLNDTLLMFKISPVGGLLKSVKHYGFLLDEGSQHILGMSDRAIWLKTEAGPRVFSASNGELLGNLPAAADLSLGPNRQCWIDILNSGSGQHLNLGMNGTRLLTIDLCDGLETAVYLVDRRVSDEDPKWDDIVSFKRLNVDPNDIQMMLASNDFGQSVLVGGMDGRVLFRSDQDPGLKNVKASVDPTTVHAFAARDPLGSLYFGLRSAGNRTEVSVAGRFGVPVGAQSAALSITASTPWGSGSLTVWPCDKPRPVASSVSFVAGKSATNTVVSALSDDGKVCVYNTAATHLMVDVNGRGVDNSDYVPLQPARLMDTLKPGKTVDGKASGIGRRTAGSVTELQVTGRGRVADEAETVVLNVSTSVPSISGFVTVYPCGSRRPAQESVNYSLWQSTSNMVVTKVGAGGKACIYTSAATDLQVDVVGYAKSSSSLRPLTTARLLDSRMDSSRTVDGKYWKIGRRGANSVTQVEVTGRGRVTSDASSVVLTIGAINPTAAGTLKVYQCGINTPNAISVSYLAGATTRTTVLAKVGTGGKVCIKTSQGTDLTVDVNAYIGPDGTFAAVKPMRAVNTAVK